MSSEIIKSPFGAQTHVVKDVATGAIDITIVNSLTSIDLKTTQATGNRTLNLTIDSGVPYGSEISIASKSNGTETLIAGTGCQFVTLTGVAGKTFIYTLRYNQTIGKFVVISSVQND